MHRGTSTNVFGYVFDVNSAAAAEICKEKAATAQVLDCAGIPHIEHEVISFLPQYTTIIICQIKVI